MAKDMASAASLSCDNETLEDAPATPYAYWRELLLVCRRGLLLLLGFLIRQVASRDAAADSADHGMMARVMARDATDDCSLDASFGLRDRDGNRADYGDG